MPDFTISVSSALEVIATISTICGAYIKAQKIIKNKKEAKELERALILQEAKEVASKHRKELESKIDLLEQKIITVEESVQKDLGHLKDAYTNEIRFLGSKIEELKEEMRIQVSQIVQLIGKLIDKN